MAVRIVTDSTSDLPYPITDSLGIKVVPALVHFDRKTYRDGIDLSADQFFDMLKTSTRLPTTSQAPVSEFMKTYLSLMASGHAIVSIHISSKISGTVNSAKQAASMV